MIDDYILFQVEEDVDNYLKFKLVGGNIKTKPNVVPHIFKCQHDRFTRTPKQRATATKINSKRLVAEVLLQDHVNEHNRSTECQSPTETRCCGKSRVVKLLTYYPRP